MNTDETLIQLLQLTSKLSTQVEAMDARMSKIESVVSNDIRQDERIASIEQSLRRGKDKFANIESRLGRLEEADGNKAKSVLRTICNYLLTAGIGFILSAVGFYIMNKK